MKLSKILILLVVLLSHASQLSAEGVARGDMSRNYSVNIEIGKAYISGICAVQHKDKESILSIVNEFGVSALTCIDTEKRPLRIVSILKPLNRSYIKRVLRRDLSEILPKLLDPKAKDIEYKNERYGLSYRFEPIADK